MFRKGLVFCHTGNYNLPDSNTEKIIILTHERKDELRVNPYMNTYISSQSTPGNWNYLTHKSKLSIIKLKTIYIKNNKMKISCISCVVYNNSSLILKACQCSYCFINHGLYLITFNKLWHPSEAWLKLPIL